MNIRWIKTFARAAAAAILTAFASLSIAFAQDPDRSEQSIPDYSVLKVIDVTTANGVATVRFNNPPINLVDGPMLQDLGVLASLLARDDAVKVVVFESALTAFFLARADVALLERLRGLEGESAEVSPFHGLVEAYAAMPKVTIAKITGHVRGAGSEFVLGLDMRFAAESARFGQPEIAFALHPGGGGMIRLPELMGRGRALEVILSGRDFKAQEAAEYGWINRSLPDAALDRFVDGLALQIASYDAGALARAKAAFHQVAAAEGKDALLTDFDRFVEAVQSGPATDKVRGFQRLGPETVESEKNLIELLGAVD